MDGVDLLPLLNHVCVLHIPTRKLIYIYITTSVYVDNTKHIPDLCLHSSPAPPTQKKKMIIEYHQDPTLQDSDLLELGMKIRIHRKRLIDIIQNYKHKGVPLRDLAPPPPPPPPIVLKVNKAEEEKEEEEGDGFESDFDEAPLKESVGDILG